MNENLRDVANTLTDLKLVTSTQVDLSYINSLAPQVFGDPKTYANIQSDIQFINQIGGQLFNYFSNPDPDTQKIWYVALAAGLTQSISDTNALIAQIPTDNPKGPDLKAVLDIFIADCQAIAAVIPSAN